MERLVSTAEACELLNLSLQGVHYRIKRGLLKSTKKDGKVFVYIDENNLNNTKASQQDFQNDVRNYYHKEIVKLKDDEIELLKNTIDWLKEKYENEIERLENSQKQVNKVFNDQITLLQKAFNEMREIYKLPNHNENKQINEEPKIISVKDFFIKIRKFDKNDFEIKQILIDRIKNEDKRFIYDKESKTITIFDNDFLDLK